MAARKILSFGDFYTIVWNLVPSVWKGVDDDYGKSLQLVLYTMSQHMYYYFYNRVVHMDELFDPDLCPEKYLKFLAGMVGWTLQGADPVSWREQIKAAPLLYKLRGTKRGLLLAEKLVGYSVFMSELYRDHIGDIVPKEKIFNNTPDSVKLKPWFRQALTNLEGELLPGRAESDQFDSFNQTNLVKLDAFGNVLRPRVLSNTRTLVFTPSSTTNQYNNITGKYSLARYAKLPRINVVLNYDSDLDAQNPDGSIKENYFSSALDLLLQFKPFHVLIQNLEVRYDLSEFIFDQTAINSDFFNAQEELEAAIVMEPSRAENTIAYSPDPVTDISYAPEAPASSLDNRGLISSVYQIIDLSEIPSAKEPSLYSVTEKSLPIKSFADITTSSILAAVNNKILTLDDFVLSFSSALTFDNTTKTITRPSWATPFFRDNFCPGRVIVVTGTVNNNTSYLISSLDSTGYVLTLTTSPVTEVVSSGTISYLANKYNPDKNEYLVPPIEVAISQYEYREHIYNPGHAVLQYNLSNLLPDPILDFKAMLSSQHGVIDFVEETAVPYEYIYGGTATFLNNKMTLIGIPYEAIATGQHVSAFDGTFITTISTLFSGTINEIGSVYTLADTSSFAVFSSKEVPIILYRPDTSGYNKVISEYGPLNNIPSYMPGLDASNITGISIGTGSYRSSVTTTYDTQTIVPPTLLDPTPLSRPWDLREVPDFRTKTGIVLIDPSTGLPYVDQNLAIFKKVYSDTALVVLENSNFTVLTPGIDYYFDNTQSIFLNSAAIATRITPIPTDYNFLTTCRLHILYLSRITYNDETYSGIPERGFRYVSRVNNKFTRQFIVNTLPEQTLSNIMPTELVSVSMLNDGTQQKTVLGTKRFKTPTEIYNRSSLKNKAIDDYNIVSRNPLNRTDKSSWTVYSPEHSTYYSGDQTVTNNWWGNYYEVKIPNVSLGVPGFIPYSDVDISEEGQVNHVSSDQWLTALQAYNPSNPEEFLVTRTANSDRAAMWNRSSCKTVSVPYIRSKRDSLQVFRRDIPTFTRTEESTDYLIDIAVPPRLDNYKYILSDGTDVSISYFSPGFSIPEQVKVTIDSGIGQKATLNTSGYGLTFPEQDTYYNSSSFGLQPETYFTENSITTYNIKPSLYAGNLPVNLDPSTNPGITEDLDTLDLLITGLNTITDTFIVSQSNQFTLSEANLFIDWTDPNTGAILSFGYYPPNTTATPNIKVFLNGILIDYRTSWTSLFDKVKSVVIPSSEIDDVVTVVYQAFPDNGINTNFPPTPQIPYTILHTVTDVEVFGQHTFDLEGNPILNVQGIRDGNRFIHDLPVQTVPPVSPIVGVPCISWYSSITSEYINSGSIPVDYQPYALYEEATPDISVFVNGIYIKYKQDWSFLLKQEGINTVAAVALSPAVSLALGTSDTITINYFSTF